MEYGRILSRAWEITWRWKILWILGFLAGLSSGGAGGNSGYRFSEGDFPGMRAPNFQIPPNLVPLLVGLGCLAVLVVIAFWVLSVIARGGLIAGVADVEDTGHTSLGSAWEQGQKRFWTLFGIGVLVALPIILIAAIAAIAIVLAVAPWFSVTGNVDAQAGRGAWTAVAILCACTLGCGLVLLVLALEQIRIYAERAAILEGLGWTEAFGRGWSVLRAHLGPTLVLWLIFILIAIAVGIVTLIVLSPILVPLFALMRSSGQSAGWLFVLCGAGAIGLVISAIINSVFQVFSSASWTLAYRTLTGTERPAPAVLASTPPEPQA